MKLFLVARFHTMWKKIHSTVPLAGRGLAWRLPRRPAGRAVEQRFPMHHRSKAGWFILLGIAISRVVSAQTKDPATGNSPAKPGESAATVEVAMPVKEPEAAAARTITEAAPDAPVAESPPETARPTEHAESASPAESVEPIPTRVSLVDGTRRVAVPLQRDGRKPPTGKSGLPVVTTPYPPKALAGLPAGWKLKVDPTVSPQPYQVKLADGRMLELEVLPPSLVPDNLGKSTLVQIERGGNSPESTLSAARKAHLESRAKVQDLIRKLEATIPAPPSPAAPPP